MRQMLRTLVVAAVLAPAPAMTQDTGPKPYLFSQGHNGTTQSIYYGTEPSVDVQIQLPAGPFAWGVVEARTTNAKVVDGWSRSSKGRIPNADVVQVTALKITAAKPVQITMQASAPLPANIEEALPGGLYTIYLNPVRVGG